MKKLLILTAILIISFAFGQRGDSFNFNLKVKFEESIPVENIELYYLDNVSNRFNSVNYRMNKQNEIEIYGVNYCIAGAGSFFPTIIFSLKESKPIDNSNEAIKTYKLFYLISETDTYPKDFDKEIFFTNSENPYFIKVDFNWDYINKSYKVEQIPLNQLSKDLLKVITSNNTFVKINPKK